MIVMLDLLAQLRAARRAQRRLTRPLRLRGCQAARLPPQFAACATSTSGMPQVRLCSSPRKRCATSARPPSAAVTGLTPAGSGPGSTANRFRPRNPCAVHVACRIEHAGLREVRGADDHPPVIERQVEDAEVPMPNPSPAGRLAHRAPVNCSPARGTTRRLTMRLASVRRPVDSARPRRRIRASPLPQRRRQRGRVSRASDAVGSAVGVGRHATARRIWPIAGCRRIRIRGRVPGPADHRRSAARRESTFRRAWLTQRVQLAARIARLGAPARGAGLGACRSAGASAGSPALARPAPLPQARPARNSTPSASSAQRSSVMRSDSPRAARPRPRPRPPGATRPARSSSRRPAARPAPWSSCCG